MFCNIFCFFYYLVFLIMLLYQLTRGSRYRKKNVNALHYRCLFKILFFVQVINLFDRSLYFKQSIVTVYSLSVTVRDRKLNKLKRKQILGKPAYCFKWVNFRILSICQIINTYLNILVYSCTLKKSEVKAKSLGLWSVKITWLWHLSMSIHVKARLTLSPLPNSSKNYQFFVLAVSQVLTIVFCEEFSNYRLHFIEATIDFVTTVDEVNLIVDNVDGYIIYLFLQNCEQYKLSINGLRSPIFFGNQNRIYIYGVARIPLKHRYFGQLDCSNNFDANILYIFSNIYFVHKKGTLLI